MKNGNTPNDTPDTSSPFASLEFEDSNDVEESDVAGEVLTARSHKRSRPVSIFYMLAISALLVYLAYSGPIALIRGINISADRSSEILATGTLLFCLGIIVFLCWYRPHRAAWGAMIVASVSMVDVNRAVRSVVVGHGGPDPISCVSTRSQGAPLFEQSLLLRAQYATAVSEIKSRIFEELCYFGLKFLLLGAVLIALYKLMADSRQPYFETVVARRRVALFFVVPVIASAVIDASSRFNAKMMENIGTWVYCLEEGYRRDVSNSLWEHSLRHGEGGLFEPAFALMRSFPYSLTVLLFSITIYVYFIIANYVHDSSRLVTQAGCLAFALFTVIAYSYRSSTGLNVYAAHCLTLCLVGCYCLRCAYFGRRFLEDYASDSSAATNTRSIPPDLGTGWSAVFGQIRDLFSAKRT